VLVGEPTLRLVRDAAEVEPVEPLELKGKAEPVPAYRLRAAIARIEGALAVEIATRERLEGEIRELESRLARVEREPKRPPVPGAKG